MSGQGLEMADGILGLSPKNYGRHSLLPELKINGLIDRTIVSFSNSFYQNTSNFNITGDKDSYVIFGGINQTQIVGGENGLQSLKLVKGRLNPTMYWGTLGRGFRYGKNSLMDPNEDLPILAVIDSGTTLMVVPEVIYEKLIQQIADKMKNDHEVNMICARSEGPDIDVCYFNNTMCAAIAPKLSPISFLFDQSIFELKSQAYLKDDLNKVEETGKEVNACVLDIRPGKDKENPNERRFLMGNTFLKNFYSVYDYDWEEIKLGVNIHSQQLANAY